MSGLSKSVAIIDADGILFAKATTAEAKIGDGEYMPLIGEDECYMQILHEFDRMQSLVKCDTSLVCLSDSSKNCFRKKIYPDYKENRKASYRPTMLEAMRQRVLNSDDGYGKLAIKTLEADDVCGISSGILQERGKRAVIVSPDKDMATIPGLWFNPRPSLGGAVRPIETITELEADRNFLTQALTGDSADGYPGCPGIGPKKSGDILNNCYSLEDMWEGVVEAFLSKGLTEDDALVQARTARILRNSDWDSEEKKVILWSPPSND